MHPYFLNECVKEVGGCPRLVETDCGTKNGVIASLESVFLGGLSFKDLEVNGGLVCLKTWLVM